MADSCCAPSSAEQLRNKTYRRVLWAVLSINAAMFMLEIGASLSSGSASLLADSVDFLGDAGNYAISLFVVGMAVSARAGASMVKAASMGLFGIGVIFMCGLNITSGTVPHAETMGFVGILALTSNAVSFGLLWQFRQGDSNMRSAWICTRNDVLGNLAVMGAALGVFGTGTLWPDIAVAAVMGGLAIHGAWVIMLQARMEHRTAIGT